MVRLFVFALLFLPFFTFADSSGSFFTYVTDAFNNILDFFFVDIPSAIDRFFAWLVKYYIYLKLKAMVFGVELAHEVAVGVLELLELNDVINKSANALPNNVKALVINFGFFDALALVIEAFFTRLAYSVMN